MTTRRSTSRFARGYTIIELVMSLSVLAVGASGVIAMQKVAIASNRHAKDLAVAARVAEAWADQLAQDGSLWTLNQAGTSTLANTVWLKLADPSQIVDWFPPNFDSLRNFGSSFGAQGNPLNPTTQASLARFCVHLRFGYLHSATAPTQGSGIIRAQIRVFWQAEDATVGLPASADANLCSVDTATLTTNLGAFHVIYLTTSVAQAPSGLL